MIFKSLLTLTVLWKKMFYLCVCVCALMLLISFLFSLGGVFHRHVPLRGARHPPDQRSDPPRCSWWHPLLYHTKMGETKWCKGNQHFLAEFYKHNSLQRQKRGLPVLALLLQLLLSPSGVERRCHSDLLLPVGCLGRPHHALFLQ